MNPFAELGLGAAFMPGPFSYTFDKLALQTPQGPQTLVLVRFATPVGLVALPFTQDLLRSFGAACIEQASGLTVASGVPTNGKRKFEGFSRP